MLSILTILLAIVLFVGYTLEIISGEYVVKTIVSGIKTILTGITVAVVIECYQSGDQP